MAGRTIHDKALHGLEFFVLVMLMQRAGASEFRVGGSDGWTVPTDPKALSYNQWAEMNRFQIGDSLLFVYQIDKDSVLQVKKEDYDSCNTASPLETFDDGNTSFKFNRSGPYYFICGIAEHCNKNEKLVAVVMADRSKTNQTSSALPPPPPTVEITPSSAPSGEESPSPPSPPPNVNGASSKVVGAIGSIGGLLIGYYYLLFVL